VSPAPAKARIFISHSSKEPEAREVQKALVAALQEPARADRFSVLVDDVTLVAGDMWRARINLWVGGCDAAVILLSRAALKSDYVAYEASILSYRRSRQGDSLLLIPVLLDDVSLGDLKKGRFMPAQLSEVEAIQGKTAPDEIVQAVLARLEMEIPCGATPLEQRAEHIVRLLDRFDKEHIVEAAAKVALPIDPWIPFAEERLRLRLAVQLLSVGMAAAVPALLDLRARIPDKTARADWVEKMVQHIASSWVDPRSIDRLPRIAKGDEPLAAVGVNASRALTAKMYVLCASCGDPEDTWRPVECDGVEGRYTNEQLIARLGEKLERALARDLACQPGEVRQELEMMNAYVRQPVVVSLPGEGITDEILEALRGRFPHVTFFLLLGETLETGPRLSEKTLEILFPGLAAGDEALFFDGYGKFRATVRVR
jgi:hypothetical protein